MRGLYPVYSFILLSLRTIMDIVINRMIVLPLAAMVGSVIMYGLLDLG